MPCAMQVVLFLLLTGGRGKESVCCGMSNVGMDTTTENKKIPAETGQYLVPHRDARIQ